MTQQERRRQLIRNLLAERQESFRIPAHGQAQERLLRGLLNIRPPRPADEAFLLMQNAYLQEEIRRKGVTDLCDLTPLQPGLYLWQGDITTLRCDAIVNAANHTLLGCFCPNHGCIDNAIHTFAGVQLRLACARQMEKQGHDEPAGRAKITPAFNLPCRYVIHTVGPVVRDSPTEEDCRLLCACYRSCLALAEERGLCSIAFCCISTGEFHFPHDRAAEIAVRTVQEYKAQTQSEIKVIFNVFQNTDHALYRKLLG